MIGSAGSSSLPYHVVVVGAGISGLCSAFFLQQRRFRVTVLEREGDVGGIMKTLIEDSWLIELGPNTILENTPLFKKLFDELKITDNVVYANETAKKRYILHNGGLRPLPTGPGSLLRSGLLSAFGKFRLLKEPFIGRATKEESVAEFFERRLGREFLDYVVNPFVAGIFAGNPENLSVQAAFPKLFALEQEYGGFLRGILQRRKSCQEEKPMGRPKLFSLDKGVGILPKALAKALDEQVVLNAEVVHIIPQRVGPRSIYTVTYNQSGNRNSIEADAVILAIPAYAAGTILHPIDPEMERTLLSVSYAPVAEVFMGFRSGQIRRPLDGFGFLVPEKESRKILGTLWSSAIFPNRAPQGCAALTTFVGGARAPDLCAADDTELQEIVMRELHSVMKITGNPMFTKIIRWSRAIPQYTPGYYKVLQAMERFEQNFRGAYLCSNYRNGISVGDCVMNAEKTASKMTVHLS